MAKKNNLISEIATRARSIDYWAFGYYLPNPDPILKRMGKDISVYRELLSDGQVRSGVRRRKAAIKGLEWRITTTNNEKVDEQIYQIFNRLPMNNLITEMLNAALYGYHISEVIWAKEGELFVPTEIIGKSLNGLCLTTKTYCVSVPKKTGRTANYYQMISSCLLRKKPPKIIPTV